MAVPIVEPTSEKERKIMLEILKKDPFEICNHELRWLIINVLFGEFYDGAIWCKSSIPIRLYRLYQKYNPIRQNPNDFVQEFLWHRLRKSIVRYGFLPKRENNKLIVKILTEEQECVTSQKPNLIKTFVYSHKKALENYQKFLNEKMCATPNCVLCGGEGHVEGAIAKLAFAGLLISKFGQDAVKTIIKAYKDYEKRYKSIEEITLIMSKRKYSSTIKDELELEELYEQIKDRLQVY